MITVFVSPDLIDTILVTGCTIGPAHVDAGLPAGARFAQCRWNNEKKYIEVQFTDPEPGPDREITIHMSKKS